ncbi:MAG TPA: hypothetical protein VGN34_13260 [Ktedonobacteraceae bacterium]
MTLGWQGEHPHLPQHQTSALPSLLSTFLIPHPPHYGAGHEGVSEHTQTDADRWVLGMMKGGTRRVERGWAGVG